jgi:hypothetical protein
VNRVRSLAAAEVVVLLVVVPVPDHDAAIVGQFLRELQDAVVEVLLRHVRVPVGLRRRHHADEHAAPRVRRRPLLPRLPGRPRAPEVAVEPDVDAVEEPRRQRALQPVVRVRAPRRRRQRDPAAAVEPVVAVEAPRQLVVVLRAALVDEEVDAVHLRVAEGPRHARAAACEECVPEVVGEVGGRLRRGEGVLAALPADGEEHEDAPRLAVLDVVADAGERVAREVERVPAVAEGAEEGDEDGGVGARVAGLAQRALVLVPAPVHGHVAGARRGEPGGQLGEEEGCQEEEEAGTAVVERHCGDQWMEMDWCCEDCKRGGSYIYRQAREDVAAAGVLCSCVRRKDDEARRRNQAGPGLLWI